MVVHHGYEDLELINPVVTLGVFDGVHKGHRMLLERVVKLASLTGRESAAVTFDPPPRIVLSDDRSGLSFLTTLKEKTKLIGETGIDHLVIVAFSRTLSNLSAYDFIKRILVEKLRISHLVVGYDHHFGRGREGDFTTILECGRKFGFTVEKIEEVSDSKEIISSTLIRESLLAGRIEEANNWLGFSYPLTGKVVEGRKIGHRLGFPTANIDPSDTFKLIPGDGVYAVEVQFEDSLMKGMLSIGSNPTVSEDRTMKSVEVNIFDFDKEIYDREITVKFRFRLRDEIKFDNTARLSEQMELDRLNAMSLLS